MRIMNPSHFKISPPKLLLAKAFGAFRGVWAPHSACELRVPSAPVGAPQAVLRMLVSPC